MSHVIAVALRSFQLGTEIKSKKSKPFPLSRNEFLQLQAKKLVAEAEGEEAPKPQPGTPSSASPVGQASTAKTASKSGAGEKPKQAKPKP